MWSWGFRVQALGSKSRAMVPFCPFGFRVPLMQLTVNRVSTEAYRTWLSLSEPRM